MLIYISSGLRTAKYRIMGIQQLHYCNIYSMFLAGWYVASYGPLIPFYAQLKQSDQTHFAYIFLVRAIANIFGSFLIRKLQTVFSASALLVFIGTSLFLSLLANSLWLSDLMLVITLFIASCSFVMLNIILVSFNFSIFDSDQGTHNIQILGFVFGVGAMAAPFFTMLLELNTYILLAISCLLLIPFYLSQELPIIHEQEAATTNQKVISMKSELLICLMMVLYATEEIGMSSWIPTYSIKTNVSDIQHSGFYSMLFWLPNCLFRLIWIWIPMEFYQKLKTIIVSLLLVTIATVILQMAGQYELVCFVGPISSGILLSNLYAFFLALPVQSGFTFTSSNSANFVIASCLGEAVLITPIGWSLGYFGYDSLMVVLCLLSALLWYVYNRTLDSLQKDLIEVEVKQSLLPAIALEEAKRVIS